MNLQETVYKFINETCAGLGYDDLATAREKKNGIYEGRSLKPNQIPYNMQKDIDRRCLALSMNRFLESGTAKDAFDVYFCFSEMFLAGYEKVSKIIELLSEYESNTSNVVMKHRDHYSHSVYVFALGLAFYQTNEKYQKIYSDFYSLKSPNESACHFIKYWGITSLFHDIGYPFELPFEQVAAYFEASKESRSGKPYIAYHNLDGYKKIDEFTKKKIALVYGKRDAVFETTDEFFAYALSDRLADSYIFSEKSIKDILASKPEHPEKFNYFMDHAYFSALILFKKIYEGLELDISIADIDVLTAVILHNSLYKFSIAFYKDKKLNKPFDPTLHPLAFMLMLCDEIQCWDRTAYGRNSRLKLYPMDCEFDFSLNKASAKFLYDEKENYKSGAISEMLEANGEKCAFLQEIESIVDASIINLSVTADWTARKQNRKKIYLSDSDFLHLYYFAVALNARWGGCEDPEKAFNELSLEYKISNINQAKNFDRYLNDIGAFYTDRPVDFPELESFTTEELSRISSMEHSRWYEEHAAMGWKLGYSKNKDERELNRIHPDMIPFEELSKEEKNKDLEPMNEMLKLLKQFDGVRIYRL